MSGIELNKIATLVNEIDLENGPHISTAPDTPKPIAFTNGQGPMSKTNGHGLDGEKYQNASANNELPLLTDSNGNNNGTTTPTSILNLPNGGGSLHQTNSTSSSGRRAAKVSATRSTVSEEVGMSSDSESDYDSRSSDDEARDDQEFVVKLQQQNSHGSNDFCIRRFTGHKVGRREIAIAEKDMLGLMNFRARCSDKPLEGIRIVGCTHINAQTAVLIETLVYLGASVRWAACNIHSTVDEVAAALAEANVPVFAWNGETENNFWWCIDQCLRKSRNFLVENSAGEFNFLQANFVTDLPTDKLFLPHIILDDGGDATNYIFKKSPPTVGNLKGIVEESITGIHRLYQLSRTNKLLRPCINVNDSIVKTKFDNQYLCKEMVVHALKKLTGVVLSGKLVLICGYGGVGKGCCDALKGAGCVVMVTEIDPICALQACMDGFRVVTLNDVCRYIDIIITCSGNRNLVLREHMEQMRAGTIIANMGHSNTEIDWMALHGEDGISIKRVRTNVHHVYFDSTQKHVVVLAEGRLLNLVSSPVPSIIMSVTAVTEVLSLIELASCPPQRYKNDIYLLPKKLDEYVAALHLPLFHAHLTDLTDEQSRYLGINKIGPFKPNYYRY